MLASFAIENFKSYRDATLKLAPLTVLIGANASGKSNAVEALRLLSWIARGGGLGTIRHEVQAGGRAMRGAIEDLGFRPSFTLSCRAVESEWERYSIRIERLNDGELRIAEEELVPNSGGFPFFRVASSSEAGDGMRVAYDNFRRGGKKPQVACNDRIAALVQLQSPARFAHGHEKAQRTIPKAAAQCQQSLSNVVFLRPQPTNMRGYSFANERMLAGDGANLSSVLFNLCKNDESKDRLLEFVAAMPERNVVEIDFSKTERGEVMVKLVETFGAKKADYDATLLSDGTLRVLAIAAAVLSAPEESLLVIEEIDNGVHPGRADRLLDRLWRVARERRLRILICSHNPALLDALPLETVPNVVFCYRDPETGFSRLTSLEDIPDYPELVAQGTIGHLMTRGILDRFVKCRPSTEEKLRRNQAWLAELWKRTG